MDSLFSLEGYSGKVWSKGIVKRHGIFVCSSDLAILCGKMRALSQISQELRQHVERSRIEILDSNVDVRMEATASRNVLETP